jgi:hypothetical protein
VTVAPLASLPQLHHRLPGNPGGHYAGGVHPPAPPAAVVRPRTRQPAPTTGPPRTVWVDASESFQVLPHHQRARACLIGTREAKATWSWSASPPPM